MKKLSIFLLFASTWMHSVLFAQKIPTFEIHFSVNHPLGGHSSGSSSTNTPWQGGTEVRTYLGGGFGANLVFADAHTASFKTGFEVNYFHTWNRSVYTGHMSGKSNVHYRFCNLSIPAMLRIHVGERVRFLLEAGVYLGIPLAGTMTSDYHTTPSYPGDIAINETRREKFAGYFSVSPAVGVGVSFPVSQRIDLFVKPELVFQKNFGIDDSPVSDFNAKFSYLRGCLGIRIDLNEIE